MVAAYLMLIEAPKEKIAGEIFNVGFENQTVSELSETVKKVIGEEKMEDLESKNPQLKELGDFVYDRAPEPSPRTLQQGDQDAPRVSCFNLSALLFGCARVREPRS
jgi:nucleoside-diphosphate-sugar epimerase